MANLFHFTGLGENSTSSSEFAFSALLKIALQLWNVGLGVFITWTARYPVTSFPKAY